MKLLKLCAAITVALTLSACSTQSNNAGEYYENKRVERMEAEQEKLEAIANAIPDWFLAIEEVDDNGFYAVAEGEGSSITTAMAKAELRAKAKLAGNVSQKISQQEKLYNKSSLAGEGENLEIVLNSFIAEQDIAGTTFDRKEVSVIGGKFVVFLRAYYPVKYIQELKDKAAFSKDLDLSSKDAQRELMSRVKAAKREAADQLEAETQKASANARLEAARVVASQLESVK